MWDRLVKYLSMFSSAVITGMDAEGYPFSVRCTPRADHARQVLHIDVPDDVPMQPGPAGLLCHSHDESLWSLKSFHVRGRLERESGDWTFRPRALIPGGGVAGPLGDMRAILNARRVAKQYLEKRGLPRPAIPWEAIRALHAESRKNRAPDR
jgi:hypothetical protein